MIGGVAPDRRALRRALVLATQPALAQTKTPPKTPAAALATPLPHNADIAYGAYQRGLYLTALAEATKRAQQNDAHAMTLLGELYAQGLGIGRDDGKAAQWYKQARAGRPRRHVRAGDVCFRRPRRRAQR